MKNKSFYDPLTYRGKELFGAAAMNVRLAGSGGADHVVKKAKKQGREEAAGKIASNIVAKVLKETPKNKRSQKKQKS